MEYLNFQQYFESEYKKQLALNVERLITDVKADDVQTLDKIERYADKWGLDPQQVKCDILNGNQYAIRQLAIDPGRQNISETLQSAYNNISLLPTRNPHKWSDGEATTKTIDGIWQGHYVFMKVIRQHGGQQEDVKREAEEFIRIVQKDTSADNKNFIVLIDDFTKPDLTRYKQFIYKNNVQVMNSDTLKKG